MPAIVFPLIVQAERTEYSLRQKFRVYLVTIHIYVNAKINNAVNFIPEYNRVQLLNTTHCNIRNNFVYSKHRAPFISVVCLFVFFFLKFAVRLHKIMCHIPLATQRNK